MKLTQLRRSIDDFKTGKMDRAKFNSEVLPELGKLAEFFVQLANLARIFVPGAYWGDVTAIHQKETGYEQALTRLARDHYRRQLVFHPNRWHLQFVQDALRRYTSDAGPEKAWELLAPPAILDAIHSIPEEMLMPDVPAFLRREIRKGIERTLFDGLTVEQERHRRRHNVPIPEEDAPGSREMDARLAQEVIGLSASRIDTFAALARLSAAEHDALLAEMAGFSDEELASQQNVDPATIRKRRQRAREKLKGGLGSTQLMRKPASGKSRQSTKPKKN